MSTTLPRLRKSTNERPLALSALSLGVRAVGLVAPDVAAELMLRAFCTPKKAVAMHWDQGLAPERQWLDAGGERIAIYRWGPSLNGKKVLLAHGWSGRSEQLRAFVEPLRAQGFAVYAFDQPAHGESTGSTANIPRFARTLRAVADHLGPLHAVVTHSMGGPAAVFAIREGLKVSKLAMIAPPSTPRKFIQGFWRMLGISDELGQRMNRLLEARERFSLPDVDVAQLAPYVSSPVLVVHDRSDREVAYGEGVQWSQSLADAKLLTTEGLGHNRLLAAAQVSEAVAQFVAW
jgi:pimeloyl-ACP methyl ester carboxylesterase